MADAGGPAYAAKPLVVVAPDSFKGTLTAAEVAEQIAAGLREGGVCEVLSCAVADGGEGTLDALAGALGASLRSARVRNPLGRRIDAAFGISRDGQTAIVEVARAIGVGLLGEAERDAEAASSGGAGDLILAARDALESIAEAREVGRPAGGSGGTYEPEILVGLGGSATTDGGAGAVAAIARAGGLGRARLVLLCDVNTSFERAAEVFAPQKGADPAAVDRLRSRLELVASRLPRDPRGVPMTGAAGGLSGGLWAAFAGRLVPGASFVLDRVEFDRLLSSAAAVVTGEGRLDAQTSAGKIVGEVADRCRLAGVPAHAVVGHDALGADASRAAGLSSVREAGTPAALRAAGAELVAVVRAGQAARKAPRA